MMKPYLNKDINVTCGIFFTSIGLAKRLKKNNTSLVGTVNKGRREIPMEIKT